MTTFLSAPEFERLLDAQPPEQVVLEQLLAGEVFAFAHTPSLMSGLRAHLAARLGVLGENVHVVGSAKVGFSLAPDTFAREFSDESDIDVVVIDAELFDLTWRTILFWHYQHLFRHSLPAVESQWAQDRQEDFYWGYLSPERIRFTGLTFPAALTPLRDFRARWFDAFRSLTALPELATRDVSGRLYRTREHAVRYHVHGLQRIHRQVRQRRKANGF